MSVIHLKEFVERIESRHGLADVKEVFVELIDLASQFLSTNKYDRSDTGGVMPTNEQVFYMYQDLKRIVQNIPDDLVGKCKRCNIQRPYNTPNHFHDKCFDCLKLDSYTDDGNCSICHYEVITKKSTTCCKYCRYEGQRRAPVKPCSKCKINDRHTTSGGITLFICLECKRESNKKYSVKSNLLCGRCHINQKHITESGMIMGYCKECSKIYHLAYQSRRKEYLSEYRKNKYKKSHGC